MSPYLLFSESTTNSDLRYFNGTIDSTEERDNSVSTDFQWQILKCRYLIWKTPEIVVAPAQNNFYQIHIIANKKFVESGELFKRITEHNLRLSGPNVLTNYLIELCLNYSLTFRLAPNWNKVGGVFIKSNDFLSSVKPAEAIRFKLTVLDSAITFAVEPLRVKLPLVNLEYLSVNISELVGYGSSPASGIVYILPTLKPATVVSVSTTIPSSCPFPVYSQIRKHWKNIHGFRLPHDEKGMLYIQVRFGWQQNLYTYPILCVRPSPLIHLPSLDEKSTVGSFIHDIMKRSPTVCQHKLNIHGSGDLAYQFNNCLYSSVKIPDDPNLERSTPNTLNTNPNKTQMFSLQNVPMKRPNTPPVFVPQVFINEVKPTEKKNKFFPIFNIKKKSSQIIRNEKDCSQTKNCQTVDAKPKLVTESVSSTSTISQVNPISVNKVPTFKVNITSKKTTSKSQDKNKCTKNKSEVDIKSLALSSTLQKASVASLISFCRQHGISAKAKDKKEVLLKKVYEYHKIQF